MTDLLATLQAEGEKLAESELVSDAKHRLVTSALIKRLEGFAVDVEHELEPAQPDTAPPAAVASEGVVPTDVAQTVTDAQNAQAAAERARQSADEAAAQAQADAAAKANELDAARAELADAQAKIAALEEDATAPDSTTGSVA